MGLKHWSDPARSSLSDLCVCVITAGCVETEAENVQRGLGILQGAATTPGADTTEASGTLSSSQLSQPVLCHNVILVSGVAQW